MADSNEDFPDPVVPTTIISFPDNIFRMLISVHRNKRVLEMGSNILQRSILLDMFLEKTPVHVNN